MHLIPPTTGECVIVRLIVVPKEEEAGSHSTGGVHCGLNRQLAFPPSTLASTTTTQWPLLLLPLARFLSRRVLFQFSLLDQLFSLRTCSFHTELEREREAVISVKTRAFITVVSVGKTADLC